MSPSRTLRLARRGGLVGLAAAAGAGAGALLAYGLWSSEAGLQGGTITAGELSVDVGTPRWEQVTPGVPLANRASGALDETPTGFYAMPGDVIEVTLPVTTFLQGDNLTGGLRVTLADPGIATESFDTSFVVRGPEGDDVSAEAELGEDVVVDGLAGTDAGVTASWDVVVVVRVLGDYVWLDEDDRTFPAPWSPGTLGVEAYQVRSGPGYVDGGRP